MKLQIGQFASLMNVSVRTLHYYDEIGLLRPAGVDGQNGYRYYDAASIVRMRTILRYRDWGVSLGEIQRILASSPEEGRKILARHKERLIAKQRQINWMIAQMETAEGKVDAVQNTGGKGPSMTALMCAFVRAYHYRNASQPIFSDSKRRSFWAAKITV